MSASPPELHQKAALYAIRRNLSLNKVVEESLEKMLG
ncbi:MAG: toxin-antitoxin system HicB family antitoxin [Treponema sp.]|nr:toxin-antitoxin system HicB family antitoxin [Treponema sp.]